MMPMKLINLLRHKIIFFKIGCVFFFISSCSTVKEFDLNAREGYILELKQGGSASIDNDVNYWFTFNLKSGIKDYYFFLMKDIIDVKYCSDDTFYFAENKIFKKEIDSLMIHNTVLNWKNISSNHHISLKVDGSTKVNIYKVELKYSVCSEKYSLYSNMSELETFMYPYKINFKKIKNTERKRFLKMKYEIFKNLR